MIHIQNLTCRYPRQKCAVLEDVSLEVEQGKVIGIIGPNGAGKTTLFHLINGTALHQPEKGNIRVDCSPHERKLILSQVWMPTLLKVGELTGLVAALHGVSPRAGTAEYLQNLSLRARRRFDMIHHRRFGSLSTGERQWFTVSIGLHYAAKLCLLDEPTSGLDPEIRYLLWESIEASRRQGCTILIASHLIDEIADRADAFYLLHERQLRHFRDRSTFLKEYGCQRTDEAFIKAIGGQL